jgi:hypothetical protein
MWVKPLAAPNMKAQKNGLDKENDRIMTDEFKKS